MLQLETTINRVRPMESYVIRVYRRHESDPEQVVGLVEHPENGNVERFSGVVELVNILLTPQQASTDSMPLAVKNHGSVGRSDSNDLTEIQKKIQNKIVQLRSR